MIPSNNFQDTLFQDLWNGHPLVQSQNPPPQSFTYAYELFKREYESKNGDNSFQSMTENSTSFETIKRLWAGSEFLNDFSNSSVGDASTLSYQKGFIVGNEDSFGYNKIALQVLGDSFLQPIINDVFTLLFLMLEEVQRSGVAAAKVMHRLIERENVYTKKMGSIELFPSHLPRGTPTEPNSANIEKINKIQLTMQELRNERERLSDFRKGWGTVSSSSEESSSTQAQIMSRILSQFGEILNTVFR